MRLGVVAMLLLLLLWSAQGQPTPARSAIQARSTGDPTEIVPTATNTNTPTPTRPAAYLPLLALGPKQPDQGTVTVRSARGVYQSNTYIIYGEVISRRDAPVGSVQIVARLYDANNAFVATDYSYTLMEIVYPNEPTPFVIYVSNAPPGITRQTFTTTYGDVGSFDKVRVTVLSTLVRENNGPEVYGDVRNDQPVPLSFAEVAATFYNSAGDVTYVAFGYTAADSIAPGATDVYKLSTFNTAISFVRVVVVSEGRKP